MPQFRYESLAQDGRARAGVLDAVNRAAALRQLTQRGETPTVIEALSDRQAKSLGASTHGARPAGAGGSVGLLESIGIARRRPTLSRGELASFMRELATAIEAGLPMMQALRTVRRQAPKRAYAEILDHLIARVEAGAPLYQAAREYGRPFDDMIIGMLRAADASGKMGDVMLQLADLLDRSVELRREVLGATIYPGIIFGLIIASIAVIVTVIAPKLIEPLQAAADFPIPWPTMIVMQLAEFAQQYWMHAIAAIIGLVLFGRWWINVPANRLWFDRFVLRIPLVGRLLRDVAVARFTRTLGTLIAAGLPILDALRITAATLGNKALEVAVEEVSEKVTSGAALADPLERSGLFPPLLVQIVNLGERSGRLETMLLHAAGAFDRQVNNTIKMFTKALPPVIIVTLAPIVAFILAAILLPMLSVQERLGG